MKEIFNKNIKIIYSKLSELINKILNKFNSNNITTKLTLGISFIVFICTFTIGIIFITQCRELTLKQEEDKLIKNSEQLSEFGDMILSYGSGIPGNNFFNSLRRITDSDFWVVSSNGTIVASTINLHGGSRKIDELNEKFIREIGFDSIITYEYSSLFNTKVLTVVTPIYSGRYLKGAIMIHTDVNTVYNSIQHITVLVFISLLISLLLSIIMGILYSKHFTKPIKSITEVTKKISNRNYDIKTNIDRVDEIGELASAIDQMTLDINENINEIKELEKRAKDLVANVSHEFKTPLTLIRGYVENLQDKTIKPTKETYEKILNNTIVLEKLVNELLDLSKFQSGNVILKKEDLELKQLVKDVIDDMKNLSKKKKIKINLIEEYKDKQIINADYVKIRQLITIFLDNAIKYSNESSTVNIIIKEKKLTISDNGIGIEKSKLEQLFERYYQVDSNSKGYGLGLCIAKYIADAHNYDIKIDSIENIGTTVDIIFK